MNTAKLTANKTRCKKVTNTWDISNGIKKQKQGKSHMKNELEKEKNILSPVK